MFTGLIGIKTELLVSPYHRLFTEEKYIGSGGNLVHKSQKVA
jgi:hypothetical protein